jgi:hypothetical protein
LEGLAIGDVGILYGHFVYFTAKWYMLWPFGGLLVFFPVLVSCTEKNLATVEFLGEIITYVGTGKRQPTL